VEWKERGKIGVRGTGTRSQMFNIPAVKQYRLINPPLIQALAQVRFPVVAKLAKLEGIADLQEALRPKFPYMEQSIESTIALDLSTELDVKADHNVSWHFTDDEGRLLVIGTNVMTLSIGEQYEGIESFSQLFKECLQLIFQHLALRRCTRIGIRFLDLVADTGISPGWKEWFKGEITGWPASNIVGGATKLQSALTQTHLYYDSPSETSQVNGVMQSVVRHGLLEKGATLPGVPPINLDNRSFLLDIDFFSATTQRFDATNIDLQFKALHSQIDRFFRWSLTEEGEKEFGLEEIG
jgi:uncharacterized protein (TIGR04255 family)